MVAIHYTDRGTAVRLGAASRALTRAALAALEAPSFGDARPWRWHIDGERAELLADHRFRSPEDPQGRELTISCGAALHHSLIALAADGAGAEVTRLPRPEEPDVMAVLHHTGSIPRDPRTERLRRAIAQRHSDRRRFADEPVPAATARMLRAAAEASGAQLHLISPAAVGGPAAFARQAVIATAGDEPRDWLAAGEALSAVVLTATAEGLATSISAFPPASVPQWLPRCLPAGAGRPAALVRFGVAGRIGAVMQAR
ncbi:hypothetical protein [Dactylosporangium sp. CA-092794]|uniref:hypothetical protein n=1 Tax=Dactylosporangium sp. CA-092794 TaxID=3239929 RepID=UPI003D950528